MAFHDLDCACPIEAARRAELSGLQKVVIVGAGFAGLSAAKALAKAPVHVTLIDKRNHHLFQPLLYQVATAALAPTQIATPIRAILRKQRNLDVVLDEVDGIDRQGRFVLMGQRRLRYDHLVLATGARHSYFGRDEWERFAPGLKTLDDAIAHRRRILMAFERAELEVDAAERARLTTFVVIGGGATGVEIAGAIAELAKKALARDYRQINPQCARIILIEGANRLLGAFPEALSDHARHALEALGVEVRLGAMVTDCDAEGVSIGAERIESRTLIWAAGVQASPAAAWLDALTDRAGRVVVGPDLRVATHDNVYVIGDCAAAKASDGKPLPGVAPVAKQQGAFVAKAIAASLKGDAAPVFAYRDYGAMATVGRKAAIADLGGVHLRGFIGWIAWCAAHIYFLIGFRNRVAVALDWAWSYLTFERGARLITGEAAEESQPARRTLEAA